MEEITELIFKARNGDRKALEEVIAMYDKRVYSFIYSITRDENASMDITQETFIKLFQNIQSYDVEKNFITWLFTIAKNNSINYLNKCKRCEVVDIDTHKELEGKHSEYGNPAEIYEEKEEKAKLIKQVEALPEKYKMLIYMKYILEMSYEEISSKLEIPVHKVESRLYMARQKLLKQIDSSKTNDFVGVVKNYLMPKFK